MLVHDKVQETHETSGAEFSTPEQMHPADGSGDARPARRRWGLALAAVVGIVTVVAVTQSDEDTSSTVTVSDGSFEVAEEARMSALGGSVSVSDGSFEVAEEARMSALGGSVSVSDGSFEVAEEARMSALRDLVTAP